ncbi:MAG: undecaprenyl diphosphate synthase [Dehalococcoidia bacterium]|nr:undecaprenyl diphosphate synthase [Dehalococcoidia bacterium]
MGVLAYAQVMEKLFYQSSHHGLESVPTHVAIVMDGNGRWAKSRSLPRLAGHQAGTENIRRIVKAFADDGVQYLTLYAFSTENWTRPENEVNGLFHILRQVIDREAKALHEAGIQLRHLGNLDGLPDDLQSKVLWALDLTKNNEKMVLSLAFNYGGRAEILDAVRNIIRAETPADTVDEGMLRRYLYTGDMPDPDLIIRTAGEMRLSNFLIWQAAYSEYYSIPVYWPDFNEGHVKEALIAYSQRQRRFGGLQPE